MTRVVLFGATGMIGQGVLRECLLDQGIASVTTVGRRTTWKTDAKLNDVVLKDPADIAKDAKLSSDLKQVDACLYCLGTSAVGMGEREYTTITKDMTLRVLDGCRAANPNMRFLFVSGNGSDAKSSNMWARVKGETENEVLARSPAPGSAVMFRPGLVEPVNGIRGEQSLLYKAVYACAPLLRGMGMPCTTTEALGRAMVAAAKLPAGAAAQAALGGKSILENGDINALAWGKPLPR
ncbi:hypothetical protein HYH02_003722 [Chlamydomonas schloesseri]|uniref:NAD-dependent epimerase/dehydratase domain-containing protein n=1 Tax=Chlamydomonas schloesseri TaxID=2026947 RepID=A0A835WQ02_9CHLO|nr:hypothetical protein HYH02_003722 [Chlamydomonas schloesseri]|eukprot:KAG2451948.1 hypothetical protein HYH02_003722 [Chlamydomonas schloesseri]